MQQAKLWFQIHHKRHTAEKIKMQKKTVQMQTLVEDIQNTEHYNDPIMNNTPKFSGRCSPRNSNQKSTCDPNAIFFQAREMPVLEAEQIDDSNDALLTVEN